MAPEPQKYFVCYLDVLGQKDIMLSLEKSLQEGDEALVEKINYVEHELKGFSRGLRNRVVGTKKDAALFPFMRENGNRMALSMTASAYKTELEKVDCGVQQFSDSTVFYVAADQKLSATLFALGVSYVMGEILRLQAEGIYLRGAIGIGESWYVKGGQLCGEVLEDVDRTERSYPFYSRIVCTKRYVEFLDEKAEGRSTTDFDDCFLFLRDSVGFAPDGAALAMPTGTKEAYNETNGPEAYDYLMAKVLSRVRYEAIKCREKALTNLEKGDFATAIKYARIDWKYQWLNMWYSYEQKADEEPMGDPPEPETPKIAERFDMTDYYVAYLQFREYPSLPEKKDEFDKWAKSSATPKVTWKTVNLLAQILKALFAQRQNLNVKQSVGIQQLHSHILVYFKKDSVQSGTFFMQSMALIAMAIPSMLKQGILFRGALTLGKGWELEADCLQGPVISNAYDLAMKGSYYPRFLVSATLLKESQAYSENDNFHGFLKRTIYWDVDGLPVWNYIVMAKCFNFGKEDYEQKLMHDRALALEWVYEYGAMIQQVRFPTPAQVQLLQELQMLKCAYTRDLRMMGEKNMDLQTRMTAAQQVANRLGGVDNDHFDKCFFRP